MKISALTLEKRPVKISAPTLEKMLVKILTPTRVEIHAPMGEEELIEIWAAAAASTRRAPAGKAICEVLCHHR